MTYPQNNKKEKKNFIIVWIKCSTLKTIFIVHCLFSQRITEIPGRYIVHDGDLVELDTDTFSEVQHVHAYLLNDCLVITTPVVNRSVKWAHKPMRGNSWLLEIPCVPEKVGLENYWQIWCCIMNVLNKVLLFVYLIAILFTYFWQQNRENDFHLLVFKIWLWT